MQIQSIATIPPEAAAGCKQATPELLAAILAKYSRSNEGLEPISDS